MPEGFVAVFAAIVNVLLLGGGVYIYLALVRQIRATEPATVGEGERTFGRPEIFLSLGLSTLFLFNASSSSSHAAKTTMGANELVANILVAVALLLFVAAFLRFRGLSVDALGGFSRMPVWQAVLTGAVLLFAAYPLIFVADLLTQRVFGIPASRQNIVEIFDGSQTLQQRVLIIILAVGIAPLVEEFVFRFFLYGVVRRYFGRFAAVVSTALLFAAVHAHLPSALPLFVLGSCLALAYEWSGSILVSMAMHALFNSITLIALAFPELIQP